MSRAVDLKLRDLGTYPHRLREAALERGTHHALQVVERDVAV